MLTYNESDAIFIITQMEQGKIIDLSKDLALEAALYGKKYKLPLADSIIYATAQKHKATLYKLDKHFEGLQNVKYFEKN